MVRAAKEIQPDDEILMPYGSEYWKGDGGSIIGLQDSDGEHSDEGEDPGEGDEDPAEDPEIPAIDLVSEDTSHPFASESEGDDSDPNTTLLSSRESAWRPRINQALEKNASTWMPMTRMKWRK
jgi:hypothetical protein